MNIRLSTLAVIVVSSSWSVLSWGGPTRKEEKQHISAWEAFASDLSRGDCAMASLSDQARVTLLMGQVVSKEEYRLACDGSMADATVGDTSIAAGQLVTIDMSMFSVETTITTEAIAPKDGTRRRVSYPAAFFLEVDPVTK